MTKSDRDGADEREEDGRDDDEVETMNLTYVERELFPDTSVDTGGGGWRLRSTARGGAAVPGRQSGARPMVQELGRASAKTRKFADAAVTVSLLLIPIQTCAATYAAPSCQRHTDGQPELGLAAPHARMACTTADYIRGASRKSPALQHPNNMTTLSEHGPPALLDRFQKVYGQAGPSSHDE